MKTETFWPCLDNTSLLYNKVAYFSMEIAIDQALKTYSGGLGFLAGSHMRSVFDLKQNTVGISILWKYGYYTQQRAQNRDMQAAFIEQNHDFLIDTGIIFAVKVHEHEVMVKAWYLEPNTFGTAPIYFLSTDLPENDFLSQTITHRLYDANIPTKIAQSIILGIGGGKLLDILNEKIDTYHLNEGHGLPLAFYLFNKYKNLESVKQKLVFTTHTPEMAGNEERELVLLQEMGFFNQIPEDEVRKIALINGNTLNYTLTALRLSRKANGVSRLHGEVARQMWSQNEGICEIESITNAQNKKYWADPILEKAYEINDNTAIIIRKKELKSELFKVVADQCGKLFNPDVLTIVWARRFAGYKRPGLLLRNMNTFLKFINNPEYPIQIIWAGKPYPEDQDGVNTFNYIQNQVNHLPNCACLVGYELALSAILKKGADVWLNNPRITREASGTSGMSAAMNGTINLSVPDGWIPEFANDNVNGFYLPATDYKLPVEEQDTLDYNNLMDILTKKVVPTYYQKPQTWVQIMKKGMQDIYPNFDSNWMVNEYCQKLYNK